MWGISTDITERKRAEDQARQHQAELAHVLRLGTIGEMAAGFAHEINQPLGAVANYAQGAVRRVRSGSVMQPTELLQVLEAMAHEALRAGEIIRRMRDLARKEPSEQKAVDLNVLVRDSAQVVEGEARQLGIQVRLDLAPDRLPVVCNGVQIEQVILNLLRNALEAVQSNAGAEGCVVITSGASRSDAVEVSVRDNGIGLPEPLGRRVRPVLQHEAARSRDGPVDQPLDHRGAPRQPERHAKRERWEHVLLHAASRQRTLVLQEGPRDAEVVQVEAFAEGSDQRREERRDVVDPSLLRPQPRQVGRRA